MCRFASPETSSAVSCCVFRTRFFEQRFFHLETVTPVFVHLIWCQDFCEFFGVKGTFVGRTLLSFGAFVSFFCAALRCNTLTFRIFGTRDLGFPQNVAHPNRISSTNQHSVVQQSRVLRIQRHSYEALLLHRFQNFPLSLSSSLFHCVSENVYLFLCLEQLGRKAVDIVEIFGTQHSQKLVVVADLMMFVLSWLNSKSIHSTCRVRQVCNNL